MIKKFYVFAWLLLAGSIMVTAARGSMNGLSMVAFSLIALGLVYGFALWSVHVNTRGLEAR